jgi:hypothetical protein
MPTSATPPRWPCSRCSSERGCPYVPKLLEEHPEELYFVSTNCGKPASQISKEKSDKLFAKLESEYGIRHLDAEPRNITYSDKLGCFCIIDFELAEILPPPPGSGDARQTRGPNPNSEPTAPPCRILRSLHWAALTHSGSRKPRNDDSLIAFASSPKGAENL